MAKPFLKWVGGKTQLLPEILPRLPAQIDTYYEPFLGGGAVFFALQEAGRLKGRVVLSDMNEELITTYKAVRDDVEYVINRLKGHSDRHSEDFYYEMRADPDEPRRIATGFGHGPAWRAARMIYLNKTCFNGLYRVNKRGEFNVPWGKREKFVPDVDGLRAASKALQGVEIEVANALTRPYWVIEKSTTVYFDPPYIPVCITANFAQYTKDGFGQLETRKLSELIKTLRAHGANVLASNADVPELRIFFQKWDFTIESVSARRNINSKGDKRGKVGEVLIS